MTPVLGYNIALQIGGKTIIGRTQDDLTIAARTKESITKDDNGNRNVSIVGHDVSFSCQGLIDVTSSSDATKINRDDVIELALKTGSAAIVAVRYTTTSGDTYRGNAVITNYTESSNSEDDATFGLDLQVTGTFSKVTGSGSGV